MRTRAFTIVAVAGLTAALTACGSSGGWKAPDPVRIETDKEVANLFPSWVLWMSDAAEGQPNGLLLQDGDLLLRESLPVRYQTSDGLTLKLSLSDWRGQIGATTVSVSLGE